MKNEEWVIGPWRMKNPHTVVKLGFVFDEYKLPQLPKLWEVAEQEAKQRLGKFDAKDLFHQQEMQYGPGVLVSFRWYTPADNRTKIENEKEGMI